jgi:hypothetical protein
VGIGVGVGTRVGVGALVGVEVLVSAGVGVIVGVGDTAQAARDDNNMRRKNLAKVMCCLVWLSRRTDRNRLVLYIAIETFAR